MQLHSLIVPGSGPDPASFAYTFDKLSHVMEDFLKDRGFDRYGLFVQDYGGPVGFRIIAQNPQAPEWLTVQNSNAYEVGFTSAWDGFRGALWQNRSAETEAPLAAFPEHDAIKGIYLFGARNPEPISPDNWKSDFSFMERPNARRVQLDLFYDYRTNVELYPKWQAFLKTQQPKTIILPGAERCLLHAGGWRGVPRGFARRRNASPGGRPLCSGGLAERDRQWHARFLLGQSSAQSSPASECLKGRWQGRPAALPGRIAK
jgi:pimeloyl-ACP methyl ester carboxylesterase